MAGLLFWVFLASILYVYAGYPLLLALLARVLPGPRPPAGPPPAPSVTLLITAHNEAAVIAEKLENSLALDYPRDRLQILVADDGSDDDTARIVEAFAGRGVELSRRPVRQGKTSAFNQAVPLARGEIIVFSDANNFFDPHALRELTAPFADPTAGAVQGAKTIARGAGAIGESEGLYWKYEAFILEQENRLGCCLGVTGEALAIRRELFEPPPNHVINDDSFMALRLVRRGYRVTYAPGARSFEHASPSEQDQVARRARIVAGRYQNLLYAPRLMPFNRPLILWQLISHKYLRALLPLAMIGTLVTNLWAAAFPSAGAGFPLLILRSPYNWVMLALQVLFYLTAWAGSRLARRGRLGALGALRLLYLPAFLVNSNGAALIGLYRFLTGRQTTLWARASRR